MAFLSLYPYHMIWFPKPNGLSCPTLQNRPISAAPQGLTSNNFSESHIKHYTQQQAKTKRKLRPKLID